MSATEIVQFLAIIIASVVTAALAARKFVGGSIAAKWMQKIMEDGAEMKHPIVLVGPDKAALVGTRTVLVQHGLECVRVASVDDFKRDGSEVVVFCLGKDQKSIDYPMIVAEQGIGEGILWIEGRADAAVGFWSFANSTITLYFRVLELVKFIRARR
jgi:hypothetical protein